MEKLLINISRVLDSKDVDTKEEMMSNIIKLMQDYNIREKTDSPIDHLSADDVFSNIYADNKITVYGCGKFGEEKLVLNKFEASLLYIELHRFLGY